MKSLASATSKKIDIKSKIRCLSIAQIKELKLLQSTKLHGNKSSQLSKYKSFEATPKSAAKIKDSISPTLSRPVKTILHKSIPNTLELSKTMAYGKSSSIRSKISSPCNNITYSTRLDLKKERKNSSICLSKGKNSNSNKNLELNVEKMIGLDYKRSPRKKVLKYSDNADILGKIKDLFMQFKTGHYKIINKFDLS